MDKHSVRALVQSLLPQKRVIRASGSAWADSNIALVKYWGKRDSSLNLPQTASLSLALRGYGTATKIYLRENAPDEFWFNGERMQEGSSFYQRLTQFLDLFRNDAALGFKVVSNANLPLASGFASSASGFAAIVLALNELFDWQLPAEQLSILARLGSGSAARSVFPGSNWVLWQRGESCDGMDSYGVPHELLWPELRIGLLALDTQQKQISSRDAMALTVANREVYAEWLQQVPNDLAAVQEGLATKDFLLLGTVAERNAQKMHQLLTRLDTPLSYTTELTKMMQRRVVQLRQRGVPVYFTQDAGANLQLLFLEESTAELQKDFPELKIIAPLVAEQNELILVDEEDHQVGVGEKLAVHRHGVTHRAFSIVILRKSSQHADSLEILLQQRSSTKYHSANLWSNACCGHPRPGESSIAAGERRLMEEFGFTVPLTEVTSFHYRALLTDDQLIEDEYDHLLVGFLEDPQLTMAANPLEIQAWRWMDLIDLKRDLDLNKQKYTAWLPYVIDMLCFCRVGAKPGWMPVRSR